MNGGYETGVGGIGCGSKPAAGLMNNGCDGACIANGKPELVAVAGGPVQVGCKEELMADGGMFELEAVDTKGGALVCVASGATRPRLRDGLIGGFVLGLVGAGWASLSVNFCLNFNN